MRLEANVDLFVQSALFTLFVKTDIGIKTIKLLFQKRSGPFAVAYIPFSFDDIRYLYILAGNTATGDNHDTV